MARRHRTRPAAMAAAVLLVATMSTGLHPAAAGTDAAPAAGMNLPLTSSISGGGTYEGRLLDGVQYPDGRVQVGISCVWLLCIGTARAVTTHPQTGKYLEVGGGLLIGMLYGCDGYAFWHSNFYLGIHSQPPYLRTRLGGSVEPGGVFHLAEGAGLQGGQAAGTLTSGAFHMTPLACI